MTIVINLIVSIVVIILLQLLGMVIFSWMTRFNDMEELRKGNIAVGLALGGKFLATAIILGVAAYTNTSIWFMMMWFAVGYVCLVAVYWIFELVTPSFSIDDHLKQGNVAIGILLAMVFIGTAFAVSSLII
ncbi:putative membrane protein [Paenibacillus shirakamiensis]|uniref:Membrane protein n=1 Tax=Paenibacillus shirakamiensis TaxID=1265935 RepID=A0ABS4JIH4_9BACL|nr:putative membrane protein [Paenibacillus shirakamiensis]